MYTQACVRVRQGIEDRVSRGVEDSHAALEASERQAGTYYAPGSRPALAASSVSPESGPAGKNLLAQRVPNADVPSDKEQRRLLHVHGGRHLTRPGKKHHGDRHTSEFHPSN